MIPRYSLQRPLTNAWVYALFFRRPIRHSAHEARLRVGMVSDASEIFSRSNESDCAVFVFAGGETDEASSVLRAGRTGSCRVRTTNGDKTPTAAPIATGKGNDNENKPA